MTVKYMPEGGSGTELEIPVGRGSGIEIWFDRATGGFVTLQSPIDRWISLAQLLALALNIRMIE